MNSLKSGESLDKESLGKKQSEISKSLQKDIKSSMLSSSLESSIAINPLLLQKNMSANDQFIEKSKTTNFGMALMSQLLKGSTQIDKKNNSKDEKSTHVLSKNSTLFKIKGIAKRLKNKGKIVVSGTKTQSSPLLMMQSNIMKRLMHQKKPSKDSLDKDNSSELDENFKDIDDYVFDNDHSNKAAKDGTKKAKRNKDDSNSFNESDDIEESLSNTVEINIKIRSETKRRRRGTLKIKGGKSLRYFIIS